MDLGADEPAYLPGRRQWHQHRPRREKRARLPTRADYQALLDATLRLRMLAPNQSWSQRLNAKITGITERVVDENFAFARPQLHPIRKSGDCYRAITAFPVDDKVIDSLCAQYFRDCFDGHYFDCSLAFRLNRPNSREWALKRISEFAGRHEGSPLYVAEADIQGCFDCIDHQTVLERITSLAESGNIALDPQALRILTAYLDCYSFPVDAKTAESELRKKRGPEAHFAWPTEALREFHSDPMLAKIGIPQGGALSQVIVNALLHSADAAVEQFREEGHDLLYLRFCDDTIILSPSQATATRAFEIYLDQLRLLKLPVHPPRQTPIYQGADKKSYWETKSKAPFVWGPMVEKGEIPWISFLGYELRLDGLVRIRKSSVEKQRRKVTKLVGRAIRELDQAIETGSRRTFRVTLPSLVNRVVGKVIASAVGRITIGQTQQRPQPHSFAYGFRFLMGRTFPLRQLRELDRHRERNIRRLLRRAKKVPAQEVIPSGLNTRIPRYFGRPYSYLGQLHSPKTKPTHSSKAS